MPNGLERPSDTFARRCLSHLEMSHSSSASRSPSDWIASRVARFHVNPSAPMLIGDTCDAVDESPGCLPRAANVPDEFRSSLMPTPLKICSAGVCVSIARCPLLQILRSFVVPVEVSKRNCFTEFCSEISASTSSAPWRQLLNARALVINFVCSGFGISSHSPLDGITPDVVRAFPSSTRKDS